MRGFRPRLSERSTCSHAPYVAIGATGMKGIAGLRASKIKAGPSGSQIDIRCHSLLLGLSPIAACCRRASIRPDSDPERGYTAILAARTCGLALKPDRAKRLLCLPLLQCAETRSRHTASGSHLILVHARTRSTGRASIQLFAATATAARGIIVFAAYLSSADMALRGGADIVVANPGAVGFGGPYSLRLSDEPLWCSTRLTGSRPGIRR